ncbi:TRNA(ILE)-LYSIDINE SYNTHASE-RELATED [Salix purpurea]|uniref:tRNA(Ile)-lysidine synthetase n=1 Tax=Salix purpurea TaxID=77065 RepID=A0A9Q0ZEJ6_SALPP|nr:TRNA(ILE)-LYSIDINE SYNTHASE-RELATED [Salix purpurea]
MRYEVFQNVCTKHQIEVLLIAHHADDQAELFILRLSRNSGVLGLAGMAFTSQMFSKSTHLYGEGSKNKGILIVRPLLDFSKEVMYKVCQESGQDWVEDPTNQSIVYARNRIRMSLRNLSSYTFQSEVQGVISACRRTRAYVDQICNNLINQAVTIVDHGYAIIDLEILNPSKVTDICLSKFVALILQYVSQRNKPIRGSTSKLLLHYIRTVPCKTSFTAAGCYLCPAPRSRGTKILVCCSVNCPQNSKIELICPRINGEQKQNFPTELEQIIADGKSYSNHFVPDASDVHFLDASESVISEAKTLNIICEFWITWKLSNHISVDEGTENGVADLGGKSQERHSCSCGIGHDKGAEVRCMSESDWLYLAKLSKCPSLDNSQQQKVPLSSKMEQISEKRSLNLENLELSAQKALEVLKSIPVAARRSLPVLVNHQGLLLSIPVI